MRSIKQEQERKRKLKKALNTAVGLLILAAASFAAIIYFAPSTKVTGWRAYHGFTQNRPYVVMGGALFEEDYARLEGGGVYISVSFIKEYIDEKIFWEPEAGAVTITDYYTVRRFYAGQAKQFVNGEEFSTEGRILEIGGDAWFPASIVAGIYDYTIKYYETTGLVTVDDDRASRVRASLTVKKAALRAEADPKSPIIGYAEQGDVLNVYEKEDAYYRARLYDGRVGYISAKRVKAAEPYTAKPPKETPVRFNAGLGRRVTVMWDQFFSADSAANTELRYLNGKLTVLSPTWFSFKGDYGGELVDWADKSYVDWAHENGCAVWALLSDNFDGDVTAQVLRDCGKRDGVIWQLLNLADIYGFDGINIDFEMVRADDAAYFTQFLRELAPMAHIAGLAVSVDMYVPKAYNMYYNRAAAAEVCDYVIIMGYDEHFRGDASEGPVASIGFVEDGIIKTLEQVPRSKIILGVPLYNRVWTRTLTPQGDKLTAADYGMSAPREDFAEHGAGFLWDEATKTYYGQYEGTDDDGNIYKRMVWLEDETSLDEKLKLADKYELAGIAGWKRRLETEKVWEMFEGWRGQ